MSERRQRTATESLLTIAFGVEMATVVFAFASQAVLALPIVTEPLWGAAWVMCMIFWVYCLVKGQQLDRRKEQQ